ncbi:hypothetical protein BC938DRAFT_481654, partial [Jimgerdemannia flammicorona]
MDTKQERAVIIKTVLKDISGNYLFDYLTRRESQASFKGNSQLEHDWYFNSLQDYMNDSVLKANANIAKDKFELEKRSAAVSDFWKRFGEKWQQREEEKAAMRVASLGHLNIFGQALTVYASQSRSNLIARGKEKRDNALCEQKNQEKVEDDTTGDKDFEKTSATNESSVIMREEISSFLTKQKAQKSGS